MATFDARRWTYFGVLPQPPTLESVGAEGRRLPPGLTAWVSTAVTQ